ncbi:MAG: EAL domain-containing protein [Rhizobium sp.]|nr:EAL domain-containing protein [Rhizobium sp.]
MASTDARFFTCGDVIDQLLQDALHAVRTHLGLDVAFISQFTAGQRVFRYVDSDAGFSPLCVGDGGPLEESFCQRVVDGRLPPLIHDARDHAEAMALAVTAQLPVGAHLSVPISLDGEVFGTFCCFSREGKPTLDGQDLALVQCYANFVSRIFARIARERHKNLERHARVRGVLEGQLYHMVYQPIFHIGTGQVVGHEALTRFNAEPQRSPDKWFNEAAEVGLQDDLELAVIRRALADLDQFPEGSYVSFNISPQTILKHPLLEAFTSHPLDRIVLEVTEHASIDDYGVIADALAPHRRRGLRLAVDDAGAGYASFRHILKLKPDVIKLDSTLVAAIDRDTGIRALASALVRFAEETGSTVVAEGVESEQELRVLHDLRVGNAQGYLLGRPSPLSSLATLRRH